MNVKTFCLKMNQCINIFKEYYLKNHQEAPEEWPLERDGTGEWAEQFISFIEYHSEGEI